MNIHLDNCNIEDISPLSECRYLSDLNLSHNKISNLNHLSNLSSLYYLTLRYNNISDITPLHNLRGLYYLNLRHNYISDISILKEFEKSNISRLFLQYNNITDFSPINSINLIDNDIFEGYGEYRILRTNLMKRIPDKYLGDLKFDGKMSKISNTQIKTMISESEKISLYYGIEDWIKFKRVYLLLWNKNELKNDGEDFDRYIHTSSVKKIVLENSGTFMRIITANSEYVFTGNSKDIKDYYNRNFAKCVVVKRIRTNKIRCRLCGDIIESEYVHDFKSCSCRSVFVDGGKDYLRRCGNIEDYEELSEYEEVYR